MRNPFRFNRLATALASLALIPIAAHAQTAKKPAGYVISGARIELGDGHVIEKGSIVVRDGKIVSVGTDAEADETLEKVNGEGLTVYPGFIDAYTNRGLTIPKQTNQATYPEIRTQAPPTMFAGNRKGIRPEVEASKCLDLSGVLKDNYSQGVTAALLAPGGGSLRGFAAVTLYRDGKPEDVVINPRVGQDMSFRNGTGESYPSTMLGVIALMRQTLYDAKSYGDKKAAGANPEKDDAYEALQPLTSGQMPSIFTVDSEREMERAYRIADEFHFKLIFSGAREAWRHIDLLKRHQTPVLATIDIGVDPSKSTLSSSDIPKAVKEERAQRWQDNATNLKKLDAAGVLFALSGGGGSADDYLRNVRKVIAAGLPRDAALKGMTSNAAKILGVDDKIGTIAVGKIANLTLMNGDFAKDGTAVQMVFVAGDKINVADKAATELAGGSR